MCVHSIFSNAIVKIRFHLGCKITTNRKGTIALRPMFEHTNCLTRAFLCLMNSVNTNHVRRHAGCGSHGAHRVGGRRARLGVHVHAARLRDLLLPVLKNIIDYVLIQKAWLYCRTRKKINLFVIQ